jgi:hypothetical protein
VALAAQDTEKARDALATHLREIDAQAQVQRNAATRMLEAQLGRVKIPMAAAEAAKLRAESDMKNAESVVKLRADFAARRAIEGGRRDVTHTQNDAGGQKVAPDLTVTDLDNKPIGRARTLTEAEKIREFQGDANQLDGALKALQAHVQKYGRTTLESSEVKAERDNLKGEAVGLMGKMRNQGTMDHSEYERNTGALDTGLLRGGDAAAAGIDVVRKSIAGKYEARARSAAIIEPGASPGDRQPAAPAAKPAASPTRKTDIVKLNNWLQANPKADPAKRAQVQATIRQLMEGH